MLPSSLIVVKTPFSLLGDSLLLHIMTFKDVMWIIWHLLLVVVIFLIIILSCLNKPDSHVLQANEFSFKSAFIIFTESSSPKPPPSFPESALHCCFSFDLQWMKSCSNIMEFCSLQKTRFAGGGGSTYILISSLWRHNYLKADNMKCNEVDNKGGYLFTIKHFSGSSHVLGTGETKCRHNPCYQELTIWLE